MLVAGGLMHGCGGGSADALGNTGRSDVSPSVDMPPIGPTLSALSKNILYIAHRGTAVLYPEETYVAYDNSLRDNNVLLECDVQTLADGTLGLMHDMTVDRTTTSTGRVSQFSQVDWKELKVDANTWHGSNFGNEISVPFFSDWVARYKDKGILVPEDKDLRSMASMLAIVKSQRVHNDQVLFQCFTIDPLKQAVAAGYPACFLNDGLASPAAAVSAGIRWAGIALSAPDDQMRKWVASGINVLVWTVNRRADCHAKLALGVKGFFSNDPTYLAANAPLFATDRFELQTWLPGMLSNTAEDTNLPGRGRFMGGGYWGYDVLNIGYLGCLQGYLCPLTGEANPARYNVRLNITFDAANNNDQGRWASVFLGTDDMPFLDKTENSSGHHLVFRKNGVIEIYKKMSGSQATLLAGIAGTSIANGEEVTFSIEVNEAAITVTRLRADGSVMYSAVSSDKSARGAYLHLGRNGLACKFSRLSVA